MPYGLLIIIPVCAVISALKGKYWFAGLGLIAGWFAIIGASRLAKPESWWARHRYDEIKKLEARERFPAGSRLPVRKKATSSTTVQP